MQKLRFILYELTSSKPDNCQLTKPRSTCFLIWSQRICTSFNFSGAKNCSTKNSRTELLTCNLQTVWVSCARARACVCVCVCVCVCISHSVLSDSATSQTVPHQAPLSLGFSRQGYWSGLPFPSLISLAWGALKIQVTGLHLKKENQHLGGVVMASKSVFLQS